ncbi:hypothetical protein [Rhodococcus sp. AG1013]|uniref:hypothetical protein n=1 Tax=unclassified Rhodococcus (in: high G+C Gram-positive bacteria) TaxID=192944 RepID=UPI0011C05A2D|nr:hypothetical protein [Rhodococcus sp. AG1013]
MDFGKTPYPRRPVAYISFRSQSLDETLVRGESAMNLNLISLFPLIGTIGNLLNFGSTIEFS